MQKQFSEKAILMLCQNLVWLNLNNIDLLWKASHSIHFSRSSILLRS